MNKPVIYITCLLLLGLSACTALKHVPQGELLYTGAKVQVITTGKVKGKGSVKSNAQSVIQPAPNKTYMGMRPALWLHYVVKPKRKKGFKVWIRDKFSEEPVYLSRVDVPLVVKGIDAMLYNTGYFDSYSQYEVVPAKNGKTASLSIRIHLYPPYTIDSVSFPSDTDALSRIITSTANKTLIEHGQQYNLDVLRSERVRIDDYMKERGYYYFNPDFIQFVMDTNSQRRTVNLRTMVKRTTPPRVRMVYRIGQINIHPGYRNGDTSILQPVTIRGINYYKESAYIKPRTVVRSVFLRRDSIYDRRMHQSTLGRLNGLGVFKFINVDITDLDTTYNGLLAVNIGLTPMPRKSLGLEVQFATKSNNFIGPGINVAFRNRNTFKGAELFVFNVRAYFEAQYSGQYKGQFTYEINPRLELNIPGFIPRFKTRKGNSFLPRTKLSLDYSFLSRVGFFDMNSFKLGVGYKWKNSLATDHDLTLLNVNYFNVYRRTAAFNQLIEDNQLLQRRFQSQFLLGVAYSFFYNEQVKPKTNQVYVNLNIETAGNLLSGISQGINKRPVSPYNPSQVLGVNFSQFFRTDIDVRDYVHTTTNTLLAFRFMAGWGLPYGNSLTLPYSRQFFSGGAYSVRGFTANSLGPGSYSPPDSVRNVFYLQQGGEIKLEANAEFRFPIFGFLKGAVFVDAGNTWLNRASTDAPGGQFKWNSFAKEIALSTGAGLRADLNFFVFRFDVGIPLRQPSLPEGNRWIVQDLKFKNVVFNLAFGYPF